MLPERSDQLWRSGVGGAYVVVHLRRCAATGGHPSREGWFAIRSSLACQASDGCRPRRYAAGVNPVARLNAVVR
jgi:hypothetical protein